MTSRMEMARTERREERRRMGKRESKMGRKDEKGIRGDGRKSSTRQSRIEREGESVGREEEEGVREGKGREEEKGEEARGTDGPFKRRATQSEPNPSES